MFIYSFTSSSDVWICYSCKIILSNKTQLKRFQEACIDDTAHKFISTEFCLIPNISQKKVELLCITEMLSSDIKLLQNSAQNAKFVPNHQAKKKGFKMFNLLNLFLPTMRAVSASAKKLFTS